MSGVTLYHWEPNANSGKPMLALIEKGVAFRSHYLDLLNFDQHKTEYLAINSQGTIPAMIHDDRVLTESTAIMEYVDEAFSGPKLIPEEPIDQWRVRWWMKFMDQWLAPSFSMIGWSVFIGPAVRQKDPEELKAAIERIPMPERRVAWRKAIYGLFGELIFKTNDSDPAYAHHVPHGAFDDPLCPADTPPRTSIEMRGTALWYG